MSTPSSEAATQAPMAYIQHGDHIDTIESVDVVFKAQRKLSFTYGAVFFLVTLAVPFLTDFASFWWDVEIWGGFTLNYLFISLLYYVFLWVMAWTYSQKADRLDDRLADMAEAMTEEIAEEIIES